MRRMTVALIELAKSVVARPVKRREQTVPNIHWTKLDKPLDQMTGEERRVAAETVANEMLDVIKDLEK